MLDAVVSRCSPARLGLAGRGGDLGRSSGGHQPGGEDGRGLQSRRKLLRSGYNVQGECVSFLTSYVGVVVFVGVIICNHC